MDSAPDNKKTAAVCGLFCPACTFFIASSEDPARLEKLARRFGIPVEQLECHGCRSEKRLIFCEQHCKMTGCAAQRGLDFCGQCPEYPCPELRDFQAQMPHRLELWESHSRISEAGYEKWYTEMLQHYGCPRCHTINSAYDLACRKCGETPSCQYVRLHKDEVSKLAEAMGA